MKLLLLAILPALFQASANPNFGELTENKLFKVGFNGTTETHGCIPEKTTLKIKIGDKSSYIQFHLKPFNQIISNTRWVDFDYRKEASKDASFYVHAALDPLSILTYTLDLNVKDANCLIQLKEKGKYIVEGKVVCTNLVKRTESGTFINSKTTLEGTFECDVK